MNINEAQQQIATILRDLERANGGAVARVSLIGLDTTCMNDDGPRLEMQVSIEMHRPTRNSWGQAK